MGLKLSSSLQKTTQQKRIIEWLGKLSPTKKNLKWDLALVQIDEAFYELYGLEFRLTAL
jgi:hypothetical protein